MTLCTWQDHGYDTQPGEKPHCTCGERSQEFSGKKGKRYQTVKDPALCDFKGKETDCPYFEIPERD